MNILYQHIQLWGNTALTLNLKIKIFTVTKQESSPNVYLM